jgi:hypothetical protein
MMANNHHNVGCKQHFFWQYLTVTGSSATILGATLRIVLELPVLDRVSGRALRFLFSLCSRALPRVYFLAASIPHLNGLDDHLFAI